MVTLTEKEKTVLRMVCEEKSTKIIGSRLQISPSVVEKYKVNIRKKSGSINIAGMVVFAITNGIYKPPSKIPLDKMEEAARVFKVIAKYYGFTPEQVKQPDRTSPKPICRQMICYHLTVRLKMKLSDVARMFRGYGLKYGHDAVIHNRDVVKTQLEPILFDNIYKQGIEKLNLLL